MISGDRHYIALDSGEYNLYGGFPILHCGAVDSNPKCKMSEIHMWTSRIFMYRGQYCMFEIYEKDDRKCLKVDAYKMDQKLDTMDFCDDSIKK